MAAIATRPPFAANLAGRTRRFVQRGEARAAAPPEGSSLAGFTGHAIVYDEWTSIFDWYGEFMERVDRGACARAIAEDDIRLLFNHDANCPIARSRAGQGTLRLSEDATGLLVEADMDTRQSYVRDLVVALERGDLSGMSFAFEATRESWDIRPDGMYMRTIHELTLYDVSPVTYPAYEATDAGLRGLASALDLRSLRQFVESRKGRRNSAADVAILRSAVDTLREQADELETLLTDEENEPAETESARAKALAANQSARNRAFARVLGFAPQT